MTGARDHSDFGAGHALVELRVIGRNDRIEGPGESEQWRHRLQRRDPLVGRLGGAIGDAVIVGGPERGVGELPDIGNEFFRNLRAAFSYATCNPKSDPDNRLHAMPQLWPSN
jgi:hypothetical protein